jgi:hypothetical protein
MSQCTLTQHNIKKKKRAIVLTRDLIISRFRDIRETDTSALPPSEISILEVDLSPDFF